jgi:antitoxin component of RelBE/YafQ-DinJ toxin-antitoxin module
MKRLLLKLRRTGIKGVLMKNTQVILRIGEDLKKRAEEKAKEQDMSLSELIRYLLQREVEKEKP